MTDEVLIQLAEQSRVAAELSRVEAERSRVFAETARESAEAARSVYAHRFLFLSAAAVGLLLFIAGMQTGATSNRQLIAQLQIDLNAHKAILLHPGAALSSVVQSIDDRLRILEEVHGTEVKK